MAMLKTFSLLIRSPAVPCMEKPFIKLASLVFVPQSVTSARFLAEIGALDLDGNIRNLSGDKMSCFDGNTADPIRFYGDGVDLINGTSLLQQAGEDSLPSLASVM